MLLMEFKQGRVDHFQPLDGDEGLQFFTTARRSGKLPLDVDPTAETRAKDVGNSKTTLFLRLSRVGCRLLQKSS